MLWAVRHVDPCSAIKRRTVLFNVAIPSKLALRINIIFLTWTHIVQCIHIAPGSLGPFIFTSFEHAHRATVLLRLYAEHHTSHNNIICTNTALATCSDKSKCFVKIVSINPVHRGNAIYTLNRIVSQLHCGLARIY